MFVMRPPTLLLAVTVFVAGGCASAHRERPYLEGALKAARWIRSVERVTEAGKTWPVDPEKPDDVDTSLYAGSTGVALFFLEAYASTGEGRLLANARAGADDLLARIPDDLGPEDAGLYTGIAGVGFALLETYKVTGDEKYRAGVGRCVDVLSANARKVGDGVEWNDVTDIISGSAGIGLFLLYAARELDLPEAASLAVAAGRRLIELGQDVGQGKNWAMSPTFPRLMPNFSHGTAGVAYFLATLYEHTGAQEFLDTAVAGARYLQSVAATDDGGCRIFHHEPGGEELFYLGWCHGPVGTARLFYRLAKVTNDPEWMRWVRRCAYSVMTSGIPQTQTPGFWNNVGQCCGSAGVADFFLDLYRATQPSSSVVPVAICQRAMPSLTNHLRIAPAQAAQRRDNPTADPPRPAVNRSPAPTPVAATRMPGATAANHPIFLAFCSGMLTSIGS